MIKKTLFPIFLFALFQSHSFGTANHSSIYPVQSYAKLKQIDSIIATTLQKFHIPGAVFTMVQNRKVVMNQGYGVRNLENSKAVNARSSVFRVASLSKVITTIACLQLVDHELLDLDRNVNEYLKSFKIDSEFEEPVTLRHLLTHTGGFDDFNLGRRTRDPSKLPTLENYLAERMPERILPPGEVITYSNHGMALAGLLVELVSKEGSYESYVQNNIFDPLEMHHSSFSNPSAYGDELVTGYRYSNGMNTAEPFEYLKTIPSSMLMTTGSDMANLLKMLLDEGKFNGKQVLSELMTSRMFQVQFRNHPLMTGIGFGFFMNDKTNPTLAIHTGNFAGFHSAIYLYPERNTGFFMSFTNNEGYETREKIMSEIPPLVFSDEEPYRMYQYPRKSFSHNYLKHFTGRYLHTRNPRHTIDKLELFPGAGLRVHVNTDKSLDLNGWDDYYPIDSLEFQNEKGDIITFGKAKNGDIKYLFMGSDAYQKQLWYQRGAFQALSFLSIMTAFLVYLIYSITKSFRRSKNKINPDDKALHHFNTIALGVSALSISFFVFLIVAMNFYTTQYEFPIMIKAILALPHISALLSLLLPYYAYKIWQRSRINLFRKTGITLFTLLAIHHIWMLNYWNVLFYRI